MTAALTAAFSRLSRQESSLISRAYDFLDSNSLSFHSDNVTHLSFASFTEALSTLVSGLGSQYRAVTTPFLSRLSRSYVEINHDSIADRNPFGVITLGYNKTFKEIFFSKFLELKKFLIFLFSFLKKNVIFVTGAFALMKLILFVLVRKPATNYKQFYHPGLDITIRPTRVIPPSNNIVVPPMVQPPYPTGVQLDINMYDPSTHEQALALIEEYSDLTQQARFCSVCGYVHADCTCPAGPLASSRRDANMNINRLLVVTRRLSRLLVEDEDRQFFTGESFVFPLEHGIEAKLRKYFFGRYPSIVLTVRGSFRTNDNRPTSERHISVGNTRYWVFSVSATQAIDTLFYTGVVRILPEVFPNFDLPCRDIVVSEDHTRVLRRGSLSEEFTKNVRSHLECSLSTPIADNHVLHHCNTLKDASFLLRTFQSRSVQPYSSF